MTNKTIWGLESLVKVESERLPGSVVRLEIDVDKETVDKEIDRAYRRLANRVVIPGFRKGKAPRVLIERYLGEEAIFEEATREIVPNAIEQAVEQEKINPIAEPQAFKLLEREPFRFEVTLPVEPTVKLGDYKSVRVERREVSVTDEDVDKYIESLREREGVWVTPDPARPAKNGDQLVVDIEEQYEGEEPRKREDLTIVLGRGYLPEDVEKALEGAEEGKDYEVESKLPEDYPVEEYAGKPVKYKVTVKSIKELQLPDLDDDFAKRTGLGAESVEDLRQKVRERLQAEREAEERDRVANEVIEKMVETSTVDMPQVLIEHEVDHQLAHIRENLSAQGIPLEQYLRFTQQTIEDLRNTLRPDAEKRLTRRLVLSEIAKAENIEVDESEIQREIDRIAERIDESERAEARALLDTQEWRDRIRADIYDRRFLDRIVEIATGEPLYPKEEPASEGSEQTPDSSASQVDTENSAIQDVSSGANESEVTAEGEALVQASEESQESEAEGNDEARKA